MSDKINYTLSVFLSRPCQCCNHLANASEAAPAPTCDRQTDGRSGAVLRREGERWAGKSVAEITHFMSSGTTSLNSSCQSPKCFIIGCKTSAIASLTCGSGGSVWNPAGDGLSYRIFINQTLSSPPYCMRVTAVAAAADGAGAVGMVTNPWLLGDDVTSLTERRFVHNENF